MNALMDGIIFIMLNAQVGIEIGATGWSYF
jgi:hypothetical protein|nr:MAG TPA: hypothetical protein [Caudoviricetes sp.]